jgi:small-conductance mechanosensitive channel
LFFAIEKKLRESGIEIPFPQQDLHVRSLAADARPVPPP